MITDPDSRSIVDRKSSCADTREDNMENHNIDEIQKNKRILNVIKSSEHFVNDFKDSRNFVSRNHLADTSEEKMEQSNKFCAIQQINHIEVIHVGLVGCGYWGKNYARLLTKFHFGSKEGHDNMKINLKYICDQNETTLREMKAQHTNLCGDMISSTEFVTDLNLVLSDEQVNMVFVLVPIPFHFEVVQKSLLANKHVFVEKPMVKSSSEAEKLIELAASKNLFLACGIQYLYNPHVQTMKEEIERLSSISQNAASFVLDRLGSAQPSSEHVLWELALHDVSILQFIQGVMPEKVYAIGANDSAILVLSYKQNISLGKTCSITAEIRVSRLTRRKTRKIVWQLQGGNENVAKEQIIFDELNIGEASPKLHTEPLYAQMLDVFSTMLQKTNVSDCKINASGIPLQAVQILEAAILSIDVRRPIGLPFENNIESVRNSMKKDPIAFSNLKANYESIQEEVDSAIQNVLQNTDYIGNFSSRILREFETNFANYIGVKHAVGVNSGTDALILSLKLLGLGEGDEVIVPSNSYIASALGASANGCEVIFVDHDADTFLVNVQEIENKLTPRTRAVILVHLYGQSCSDTILHLKPILQKHETVFNLKQKIFIIEDAAQAHGAECTQTGAKVGSIADVGCFSFYPAKNLGAYGDAGMVTTNNDQLSADIRSWRALGANPQNRYDHQMLGGSSRMDNIHAAVLNVKLKHLDQWNQARRNIASLYFNNFDEKFEHLRKLSSHMKRGASQSKSDVVFEIKLPRLRSRGQIKTDKSHVWHLFVIQIDLLIDGHRILFGSLDDKTQPAQSVRDWLMKYLKDNQIFCGVHYPIPIHESKAFGDRSMKDGRTLDEENFELPIVCHQKDTILSLPIDPHISADEVSRVTESVFDFLVTTAPVLQNEYDCENVIFQYDDGHTEVRSVVLDSTVYLKDKAYQLSFDVLENTHDPSDFVLDGCETAGLT